MVSDNVNMPPRAYLSEDPYATSTLWVSSQLGRVTNTLAYNSME
jgi:hypothetical protein